MLLFLFFMLSVLDLGISLLLFFFLFVAGEHDDVKLIINRAWLDSSLNKQIENYNKNNKKAHASSSWAVFFRTHTYVHMCVCMYVFCNLYY